MAIFSSFFIGVYGAVVVYQERSFRRGVAYVIAMVAEFDEYTNDWLYLREGSVLPKPKYRKKKVSEQTKFSTMRRNRSIQGKLNAVFSEAPAMLVPSLTASRSIREAIQEVKMVQVFIHPPVVAFKIAYGLPTRATPFDSMSFAANFLKRMYVKRKPEMIKTLHVVSSAFKATLNCL
ncbi:PREDICTED: uncharacterized protein LOC109158577 [Ipomoea nil]|uniref:uncharacterized protein LOC109158577 n=1 Tax=Ipomoea nil TaxID=35883 RepID=UPI00090164AA|nr:PREDICTED: uncharacterized protein LOC109158577 [Ipomoea nil]